MINNGFKDNKDAIEIINRIDRDDPELRKIYDAKIIELARMKEKWGRDSGYAEALFKEHPNLLLKLDELAKRIEASEEAIVTFMENLGKEIENGSFDIKVDLPPAATLRLSVEPIWQNNKEKELKLKIKSFEKALDDLLKEIEANL